MRPVICIVMLCMCVNVSATDLLRLGSSARSMGSGGVLGLAADPLTVVSSNPALLSGAGDNLQLGLTSVYVDSTFTSSIGESATAERGPGVLPEFAVTRRVADTGWFWGAALTISSAMQADFDFIDPAGALGVSYGNQTHRAQYAVAKLNGALSYALNDALSVGLSLGLVYNRNELESPYIFQSHPVLQNLKVLVDLEAEDIGLASALGMSYALSDAWQINAVYNFETKFSAHGDLSGNLGQLGMGIQENFNYDVNVKTAVPASLVTGITWQASDRLQLGFQYDWINWEDSFKDLPIRLTEGTNADLNAFLGENFINDTAPLDWHDQYVVHVGGNLLLDSGLQFRFGLERGNAQVPRSTQTPMTAAILERAYSLGLRMHLGGSAVDVAYRLSDGADVTVINSALRAGEYSNTRQTLRLHSVGVSITF